MTSDFQNPDIIRAHFAAALSSMYKVEVPAYAQLIDIVEQVNAERLTQEPVGNVRSPVTSDEDIQRISVERHGAIRLGTAEELSMMARMFAVMGMEPVGYYDLSVASVPVHSTAFRPTHAEALSSNPFRVFTSLLRLELIEDSALRKTAEALLNKRSIFTEKAISLTNQAEIAGGLDAQDANRFVAEVCETFRWHSDARVDRETFEALLNSHRLIADVVSFKGPHINHLTPRTLDIDAAQDRMREAGLPAKAIIEGPPRRSCPILLRQTAFKALEEAVSFPSTSGGLTPGTHTARFGEIEQRGAALTPQGRRLYDQLLDRARQSILPEADGSNAQAYMDNLEAVFQEFPDTWREMHDQQLAYFSYQVNKDYQGSTAGKSLSVLLDEGALTLRPVTYEDFLPVSAAGIFQSNLGDSKQDQHQDASNRYEFETAMGRAVIDEFALYDKMQKESWVRCQQQLTSMHSTAL